MQWLPVCPLTTWCALFLALHRFALSPRSSHGPWHLGGPLMCDTTRNLPVLSYSIHGHFGQHSTGQRLGQVGSSRAPSELLKRCFYATRLISLRIVRSVKTDLMGDGANSTILVARVNKSDSGNYSCSISPDQFYTVFVHVLNGKWHCENSFHIYDIHKVLTSSVRTSIPSRRGGLVNKLLLIGLGHCRRAALPVAKFPPLRAHKSANLHSPGGCLQKYDYMVIPTSTV